MRFIECNLLMLLYIYSWSSICCRTYRVAAIRSSTVSCRLGFDTVSRQHVPRPAVDHHDTTMPLSMATGVGRYRGRGPPSTRHRISLLKRAVLPTSRRHDNMTSWQQHGVMIADGWTWTEVDLICSKLLVNATCMFWYSANSFPTAGLRSTPALYELLVFLWFFEKLLLLPSWRINAMVVVTVFSKEM